MLSEGANSALVELDFSRYDKNDNEFLRSTGFYVLTKNLGYWQILTLINTGNLAGAVSNKELHLIACLCHTIEIEFKYRLLLNSFVHIFII